MPKKYQSLTFMVENKRHHDGMTENKSVHM